MELETMMLSEISHAQKIRYFMFSLEISMEPRHKTMMRIMMTVLMKHECERGQSEGDQ
jgi:hypothetical protein